MSKIMSATYGQKKLLKYVPFSAAGGIGLWYDIFMTTQSNYTDAVPQFLGDSPLLVTDFVNSEVAVVILDVNIPGVFVGRVDGVSKRDPVDRPNDAVALKLAYGRAFEKLGRKVLKQANGLVKHADTVRDAKVQARAAKVTRTRKVKAAAKKKA